MSRIKWLLPLLLLLLVPFQSKAIVTPYQIQRCFAHDNGSFDKLTLTCNLHNTHTGTGYKILFAFSGTFATFDATTGTTEAPTCPAPATQSHNFGFGAYQTVYCYVAPSATHTTFTVNVTVVGNWVSVLAAIEVYGLGAEDTTATTGNANGLSATITTTGTNEWIIPVGQDFAHQMGVTGSQNNLYQAGPGPTADSGFLEFGIQFAATATSYTMTDTSVTGTPRPQISIIAFAAAGTNPAPNPLIVQSCDAVNLDGGAAACSLSNVQAGNKLLLATVTDRTSGGISGAAGLETIICPASAQGTDGVSGTIGACYADIASNHSVYAPALQTGVPNATMPFTAMEVSGLVTGVDTGSEAFAASQTINYTTVQANELTFVFATDSGTVMNASGAIPQVTEIATSKFTFRGLGMVGVTTASGANSTTFVSSNTHPMVATLSFGGSAVALNKHKAYIF